MIQKDTGDLLGVPGEESLIGAYDNKSLGARLSCNMIIWSL